MMAPWRSGMLSMIWLVAVSAAQASAPTVSVSLSGPDEGWCGDSLYYSASGEYNVDGATQQEIRDGEATVDVEYLWSYSPAECLGCNRWLSAGTEKATLLVFTTKTGTWHSAMAQGG